MVRYRAHLAVPDPLSVFAATIFAPRALHREIASQGTHRQTTCLSNFANHCSRRGAVIQIIL
jgi:hypothetical protein